LGGDFLHSDFTFCAANATLILMVHRLTTLAFLGLASLQLSVLSADTIPALIPRPANLEFREGVFKLGQQTAIEGGVGAEAEARELAEVMRRGTGLPLPLHRLGVQTSDVIRLEQVASLLGTLGGEGYRLSVTPEVVRLEAATAAGLFYGGVTLRQLLPPASFRGASDPASAHQPWNLSCLEIEDYPRFAYRGLLLDVARHYMPLEFLKRFIDLAALHKLNRVQFHLTDDQGWRIEIKKYPRLTEVGSTRAESPAAGDANKGDGLPYGPFCYTQAELRELVAYAQARHVVIVPEIEMPGHMLAALTAYPRFSCTGGPFKVRTRWGIEPDVLCPGNDEAIQFARDVLAEVMAVFPGPFIHIGGDESPRDRWKQCPKCQARMRAEGLKREAELQTYLNHRIEEFLAQHQRRLLGWDEILEGGLTPGAVVMSWRGMGGGVAAAGAGHDVIMSPTTHCYFDYAQARGPGEPESIGGFIPLPRVYAFEPVPAELPEASRGHILGAQGNVWTEFIRTGRDVEYFAYPRAVALAEVIWSPAKSRDYAGFERRLAGHLKRLDALGVNYRKGPAARDANAAATGVEK
jgi:hexosaminidase